MFKKRINISPRFQDLMVETSLLLGTFLVIIVFLFIAFIGFLYPFPTYKYFQAVVEYKNEVPIVAEDGGVIIDVLHDNFDTVKTGEAVVKLSNTENQKQYQILSYEIRKAEAQLEKSLQLQELGSISPMIVSEQRLALKGLQLRQRQLSAKVIRAPYDGQIYFNISPDEMLGNFVFTGQRVGYLYSSEKKIIKVVASTAEYRRFKIGSEMKLFSGELDLKKPQMTGKLYQKLIDRKTDELLLYGDISDNYDNFSEYAPGSEINVGILITSKSLFEAFFDYDLYSVLAAKYDLTLFEKIDKFLLWIQE